MTNEEAEAIIQNCGAWICPSQVQEAIGLDGDFTLEQLKALVLLIEAKGYAFIGEQE